MAYTQTYTNAIEKIRELKDKNQKLKECWQNSVTERQEQKERIAELEAYIDSAPHPNSKDIRGEYMRWVSSPHEQSLAQIKADAVMEYDLARRQRRSGDELRYHLLSTQSTQFKESE